MKSSQIHIVVNKHLYDTIKERAFLENRSISHVAAGFLEKYCIEQGYINESERIKRRLKKINEEE